MKKDVLIRAVKTFIQAFLGAVTADEVMNVTDGNMKKFLVSLAVAGISAGISAVWNMTAGLVKEA